MIHLLNATTASASCASFRSCSPPHWPFWLEALIDSFDGEDQLRWRQARSPAPARVLRPGFQQQLEGFRSSAGSSLISSPAKN